MNLLLIYYCELHAESSYCKCSADIQCLKWVYCKPTIALPLLSDSTSDLMLIQVARLTTRRNPIDDQTVRDEHNLTMSSDNHWLHCASHWQCLKNL